jgi:hypothetical protein
MSAYASAIAHVQIDTGSSFCCASERAAISRRIGCSERADTAAAGDEDNDDEDEEDDSEEVEEAASDGDTIEPMKPDEVPGETSGR